MKKIKETKKKATKKVVEEETINKESIIKTFIVLAIVFIGFYGLTILVLNTKTGNSDSSSEYNNIKRSSSDIIVSDILKQEQDTYYVMAIMGDDAVYKLYTDNMSDYIYYLNLDNALNKGIIGDETIVDEDVRNIKIKDTTLFVVENHTITEYYVGQEEIVNKLKTIAF